MREADKAMIMEEELLTKRQRNLEELKEIRRKRRQETQLRLMVKMLKGLSLDDLNKDMMEIKALVNSMMLS